jgi:hypothetical protein
MCQRRINQGRSRNGVMDPASIASTMVGMQAGQTQLALAQSMMKTNANQESAMAQMLASAAQGASRASLPPGVGGNLDIAA